MEKETAEAFRCGIETRDAILTEKGFSLTLRLWHHRG